MSDVARAAQRAAVLRYFRQSDVGQFPAELFTEDFTFFVPKFGVGHGLAEFGEMAASFGVKAMKHNLDALVLVQEGPVVAVEGTTEGVTADDVAWKGGETPGGRFASVFHFNPQGLIERMSIYVDPDFAGRHAEGFKWSRGNAQRW
jgi:hypothetical protein